MHTNFPNAKKAIILMNLGSPNSTEVKDVRNYLSEFLMDEYVIDYPFVPRYLLVNGIIKQFRAPKSAAAYKKVWLPEGSPLVVLTNKLRDAVQAKVPFPVFTMMRYGLPKPQEVFSKIQIQYPNIEEVVIIPLYPHWTMSSYETAVAYCRKIYDANNYLFKIKFVEPFFNHPKYIEALAASIQPYLNTEYDKILFSYHGIPVRHLRKDAERRAKKVSNDFTYPLINYQEQCIATTEATANKLGLDKTKYITTFQSRLSSAGKQWIQPFTAPTLEELPKNNCTKILIVCPAFINDCLETLEEIAMEGKDSFIENGGTSFTYIPCLNDDANFVDFIIDQI